MKWTRQRCQQACSTLVTAALIPSWASEITSLTPRSPRRASLRRNAVQNVSASEGRCPCRDLAPPVAVDADRDDHGDRDDAAVLAHLHVGGIFLETPNGRADPAQSGPRASQQRTSAPRTFRIRILVFRELNSLLGSDNGVVQLLARFLQP
jgi:hypothetical protein